MSENELYHWGIKGQRWGLRRYQNEDGSLTELGRAHYGYKQMRAEQKFQERQQRREQSYERSQQRDEERKAKEKSERTKKIVKRGLIVGAIVGAIALNEYRNSKASTKDTKTLNNTMGKIGKEKIDSKKIGSLADEAFASAFAKRTDTASMEKIPLHLLSDDQLANYNKRKSMEKTYKQLNEKKVVSKLATAATIVGATAGVVNAFSGNVKKDLDSRQRPALDLSDMSDQDLRNAIQRSQLETQYNSIYNTNPKQISRGERALSNALSTSGTVLTTSSQFLEFAKKVDDAKKGR